MTGLLLAVLAAAAPRAWAVGLNLPRVKSLDGQIIATVPVNWEDRTRTEAEEPFKLLIRKRNLNAAVALAPAGPYDPVSDTMSRILAAMRNAAVKELSARGSVSFGKAAPTVIENRIRMLWQDGVIRLANGQTDDVHVGAFHLEGKAYGLMAYGAPTDEIDLFLPSFEATTPARRAGEARVLHYDAQWYEAPGYVKLQAPPQWEAARYPGVVLALKSGARSFELRAVKLDPGQDFRPLAEQDAREWGKQVGVFGSIELLAPVRMEAVKGVAGILQPFVLTNEIGMEIPFSVVAFVYNFQTYVARARDISQEDLQALLSTIQVAPLPKVPTSAEPVKSGPDLAKIAQQEPEKTPLKPKLMMTARFGALAALGLALAGAMVWLMALVMKSES